MKSTKIFSAIGLTLALLTLQSIAYAQGKVDYKFGKGVVFTSSDSSSVLKFSARVQLRYDGETSLTDSLSTFTDEFSIRRSRLKFDGTVLNEKVEFKIEHDLVNSEVLDAVVKWNIIPTLSLWAGQTKLPGNRERVISSQKLQFVDRSLLNKYFNLDRDIGLQLHHQFNIGEAIIQEAVAVSIGEGRNTVSTGSGHAYVARIEVLPFGAFKGGGDYYGSDLAREKKPKLAVGVNFDFNDNASRMHSHLGEFMAETRDISSLQADFMFKYSGISLMGEFAQTKVENGAPVLLDTTGSIINSFYTGQAINIQGGYLFRGDFEISGRYTHVVPEKMTQNPELREYTLGLSKYVVGHSLKVQADASLLDKATGDREVVIRLQTEIAF